MKLVKGVSRVAHQIAWNVNQVRWKDLKCFTHFIPYTMNRLVSKSLCGCIFISFKISLKC